MVPSVGLLDSGLMWLVLEPKPGHCVGSLGKDSSAPHIPPPGVQMGTNKRPGKPYNMDKYQISWGEGSFYPLSLFPFLSINTYPRWRWERTARKLWSCAHKISQNQLNTWRVASTKVSFDKLFCIYCLLLLFIVHEFYFLKNQQTIVEYKGALDAISKTFRSIETWHENLKCLIRYRKAFHFYF